MDKELARLEYLLLSQTVLQQYSDTCQHGREAKSLFQRVHEVHELNKNTLSTYCVQDTWLAKKARMSGEGGQQHAHTVGGVDPHKRGEDAQT